MSFPPIFLEDRFQNTQYYQFRDQVVISIFGASQSGKTSISKQLQLIAGLPPSEEELKQSKVTLSQQLISTFQSLLQHTPLLDHSLADQEYLVQADHFSQSTSLTEQYRINQLRIQQSTQRLALQRKKLAVIAQPRLNRYLSRNRIDLATFFNTPSLLECLPLTAQQRTALKVVCGEEEQLIVRQYNALNKLQSSFTADLSQQALQQYHINNLLVNLDYLLYHAENFHFLPKSTPLLNSLPPTQRNFSPFFSNYQIHNFAMLSSDENSAFSQPTHQTSPQSQSLEHHQPQKPSKSTQTHQFSPHLHNSEFPLFPSTNTFTGAQPTNYNRLYLFQHTIIVLLIYSQKLSAWTTKFLLSLLTLRNLNLLMADMVLSTKLWSFLTKNSSPSDFQAEQALFQLLLRARGNSLGYFYSHFLSFLPTHQKLAASRVINIATSMRHYPSSLPTPTPQPSAQFPPISSSPTTSPGITAPPLQRRHVPSISTHFSTTTFDLFADTKPQFFNLLPQHFPIVASTLNVIPFSQTARKDAQEGHKQEVLLWSTELEQVLCLRGRFCNHPYHRHHQAHLHTLAPSPTSPKQSRKKGSSSKSAIVTSHLYKANVPQHTMHQWSRHISLFPSYTTSTPFTPASPNPDNPISSPTPISSTSSIPLLSPHTIPQYGLHNQYLHPSAISLILPQTLYLTSLYSSSLPNNPTAVVSFDNDRFQPPQSPQLNSNDFHPKTTKPIINPPASSNTPSLLDHDLVLANFYDFSQDARQELLDQLHIVAQSKQSDLDLASHQQPQLDGIQDRSDKSDEDRLLEEKIDLSDYINSIDSQLFNIDLLSNFLRASTSISSRFDTQESSTTSQSLNKVIEKLPNVHILANTVSYTPFITPNQHVDSHNPQNNPEEENLTVSQQDVFSGTPRPYIHPARFSLPLQMMPFSHSAQTNPAFQSPLHSHHNISKSLMYSPVSLSSLSSKWQLLSAGHVQHCFVNILENWWFYKFLTKNSLTQTRSITPLYYFLQAQQPRLPFHPTKPSFNNKLSLPRITTKRDSQTNPASSGHHAPSPPTQKPASPTPSTPSSSSQPPILYIARLFHSSPWDISALGGEVINLFRQRLPEFVWKAIISCEMSYAELKRSQLTLQNDYNQQFLRFHDVHMNGYQSNPVQSHSIETQRADSVGKANPLPALACDTRDDYDTGHHCTDSIAAQLFSAPHSTQLLQHAFSMHGTVSEPHQSNSDPGENSTSIVQQSLESTFLQSLYYHSSLSAINSPPASIWPSIPSVCSEPTVTRSTSLPNTPSNDFLPIAPTATQPRHISPAPSPASTSTHPQLFSVLFNALDLQLYESALHAFSNTPPINSHGSDGINPDDALPGAETTDIPPTQNDSKLEQAILDEFDDIEQSLPQNDDLAGLYRYLQSLISPTNQSRSDIDPALASTDASSNTIRNMRQTAANCESSEWTTTKSTEILNYFLSSYLGPAGATEYSSLSLDTLDNRHISTEMPQQLSEFITFNTTSYTYNLDELFQNFFALFDSIDICTCQHHNGLMKLRFHYDTHQHKVTYDLYGDFNITPPNLIGLPSDGEKDQSEADFSRPHQPFLPLFSTVNQADSQFSSNLMTTNSTMTIYNQYQKAVDNYLALVDLGSKSQPHEGSLREDTPASTTKSKSQLLNLAAPVLPPEFPALVTQPLSTTTTPDFFTYLVKHGLDSAPHLGSKNNPFNQTSSTPHSDAASVDSASGYDENMMNNNDDDDDDDDDVDFFNTSTLSISTAIMSDVPSSDPASQSALFLNFMEYNFDPSSGEYTEYTSASYYPETTFDHTEIASMQQHMKYITLCCDSVASQPHKFEQHQVQSHLHPLLRELPDYLQHHHSADSGFESSTSTIAQTNKPASNKSQRSCQHCNLPHPTTEQREMLQIIAKILIAKLTATQHATIEHLHNQLLLSFLYDTIEYRSDMLKYATIHSLLSQSSSSFAEITQVVPIQHLDDEILGKSSNNRLYNPISYQFRQYKSILEDSCLHSPLFPADVSLGPHTFLLSGVPSGDSNQASSEEAPLFDIVDPQSDGPIHSVETEDNFMFLLLFSALSSFAADKVQSQVNSVHKLNALMPTTLLTRVLTETAFLLHQLNCNAEDGVDAQQTAPGLANQAPSSTPLFESTLFPPPRPPRDTKTGGNTRVTRHRNPMSSILMQHFDDSEDSYDTEYDDDYSDSSCEADAGADADANNADKPTASPPSKTIPQNLASFEKLFELKPPQIEATIQQIDNLESSFRDFVQNIFPFTSDELQTIVQGFYDKFCNNVDLECSAEEEVNSDEVVQEFAKFMVNVLLSSILKDSCIVASNQPATNQLLDAFTTTFLSRFSQWQRSSNVAQNPTKLFSRPDQLPNSGVGLSETTTNLPSDCKMSNSNAFKPKADNPLTDLKRPEPAQLKFYNKAKPTSIAEIDNLINNQHFHSDPIVYLKDNSPLSTYLYLPLLSAYFTAQSQHALLLQQGSTLLASTFASSSAKRASTSARNVDRPKSSGYRPPLFPTKLDDCLMQQRVPIPVSFASPDNQPPAVLVLLGRPPQTTDASRSPIQYMISINSTLCPDEDSMTAFQNACTLNAQSLAAQSVDSSEVRNDELGTNDLITSEIPPPTPPLVSRNKSQLRDDSVDPDPADELLAGSDDDPIAGSISDEMISDDLISREQLVNLPGLVSSLTNIAQRLSNQAPRVDLENQFDSDIIADQSSVNDLAQLEPRLEPMTNSNRILAPNSNFLNSLINLIINNQTPNQSEQLSTSGFELPTPQQVEEYDQKQQLLRDEHFRLKHLYSCLLEEYQSEPSQFSSNTLLPNTEQGMYDVFTFPVKNIVSDFPLLGFHARSPSKVDTRISHPLFNQVSHTMLHNAQIFGPGSSLSAPHDTLILDLDPRNLPVQTLPQFQTVLNTSDDNTASSEQSSQSSQLSHFNSPLSYIRALKQTGYLLHYNPGFYLPIQLNPNNTIPFQHILTISPSSIDSLTTELAHYLLLLWNDDTIRYIYNRSSVLPHYNPNLPSIMASISFYIERAQMLRHSDWVMTNTRNTGVITTEFVDSNAITHYDISLSQLTLFDPYLFQDLQWESLAQSQQFLHPPISSNSNHAQSDSIQPPSRTAHRVFAKNRLEGYASWFKKAIDKKLTPRHIIDLRKRVKKEFAKAQSQPIPIAERYREQQGAGAKLNPFSWFRSPAQPALSHESMLLYDCTGTQNTSLSDGLRSVPPSWDDSFSPIQSQLKIVYFGHQPHGSMINPLADLTVEDRLLFQSYTFELDDQRGISNFPTESFAARKALNRDDSTIVGSNWFVKSISQMFSSIYSKFSSSPKPTLDADLSQQADQENQLVQPNVYSPTPIPHIGPQNAVNLTRSLTQCPHCGDYSTKPSYYSQPRSAELNTYHCLCGFIFNNLSPASSTLNLVQKYVQFQPQHISTQNLNTTPLIKISKVSEAKTNVVVNFGPAHIVTVPLNTSTPSNPATNNNMTVTDTNRFSKPHHYRNILTYPPFTSTPSTHNFFASDIITSARTSFTLFSYLTHTPVLYPYVDGLRLEFGNGELANSYSLLTPTSDPACTRSGSSDGRAGPSPAFFQQLVSSKANDSHKSQYVMDDRHTSQHSPNSGQSHSNDVQDNSKSDSNKFPSCAKPASTSEAAVLIEDLLKDQPGDDDQRVKVMHLADDIKLMNRFAALRQYFTPVQVNYLLAKRSMARLSSPFDPSKPMDYFEYKTKGESPSTPFALPSPRFPPLDHISASELGLSEAENRRKAVQQSKHPFDRFQFMRHNPENQSYREIIKGYRPDNFHRDDFYTHSHHYQIDHQSHRTHQGRLNQHKHSPISPTDRPVHHSSSQLTKINTSPRPSTVPTDQTSSPSSQSKQESESRSEYVIVPHLKSTLDEYLQDELDHYQEHRSARMQSNPKSSQRRSRISIFGGLHSSDTSDFDPYMPHPLRRDHYYYCFEESTSDGEIDIDSPQILQFKRQQLQLPSANVESSDINNDSNSQSIGDEDALAVYNAAKFNKISNKEDLLRFAFISEEEYQQYFHYYLKYLKRCIKFKEILHQDYLLNRSTLWYAHYDNINVLPDQDKERDVDHQRSNDSAPPPSRYHLLLFPQKPRDSPEFNQRTYHPHRKSSFYPFGRPRITFQQLATHHPSESNYRGLYYIPPLSSQLQPPKLSFVVNDLPGLRHQRGIWPQYVRHSSVLCYVVNLSCFDEVLFEDTTKNKLCEELQCFYDFVSTLFIILYNNFLPQTYNEYTRHQSTGGVLSKIWPVFLVFNKLDVLYEKINGTGKRQFIAPRSAPLASVIPANLGNTKMQSAHSNPVQFTTVGDQSTQGTRFSLFFPAYKGPNNAYYIAIWLLHQFLAHIETIQQTFISSLLRDLQTKRATACKHQPRQQPSQPNSTLAALDDQIDFIQQGHLRTVLDQQINFLPYYCNALDPQHVKNIYTGIKLHYQDLRRVETEKKLSFSRHLQQLQDQKALDKQHEYKMYTRRYAELQTAKAKEGQHEEYCRGQVEKLMREKHPNPTSHLIDAALMVIQRPAVATPMSPISPISPAIINQNSPDPSHHNSHVFVGPNPSDSRALVRQSPQSSRLSITSTCPVQPLYNGVDNVELHASPYITSPDSDPVHTTQISPDAAQFQAWLSNQLPDKRNQGQQLHHPLAYNQATNFNQPSHTMPRLPSQPDSEHLSSSPNNH